MLRSIAKLLAISAGVVIVLFLALFSVRLMSQNQAYASPPHPWFQWSQWNIVRPSKDSPCVKDIPSPDWIVFERVKQGPDGFWQTPCGTPLLERLGKSPHRHWLLQVDMADNRSLDELVKVLNAFDKQKTFAIYAPAQQAARYLRKQGPQWAFAADSASLVRLHLFSSLWLEPAMDFWPDFVFSTGNPEDGSQLSEREIREIERRKKRYAAPTR